MKSKIAHASKRKLHLAKTSGDEIETHIKNEKKEILRHVIITLHLQINHQQKESENIEKIKD